MMSETNSRRSSLRVGLKLLSIVVATLMGAGVVVAQSPPEKSVQVTSARAASTDKPVKDANDSATVAARLKQLEDEVAAMRELITNQQRMIETLSAKTTIVDAAGVTKDSVATEKVDAPPPQKDGVPIEDRVKKLEGKVLSFGPFRFSGDFRLRFDGIFRGADNTPPTGFAPLTHQQNARMRYRLRFNFDTDINPQVSFHGQLATGPVNNGLTMDQDFASISARHPFFVSEAWIDYHPNKATQLQGGRLQEVFADNSRFLFDDDIRFNGFNEKYVVSFKPNGLRRPASSCAPVNTF